MIFDSYKAAIEYVQSAYWVEVIIFPPDKEGQERAFDNKYRVTDHSDSDLVHYSKK